MNELIDISLPLKVDLPTWPESSGFKLIQLHNFENGDLFNASKLECDVHFGTHIDAPSHFIKDGLTIDQLPLDILVGPIFLAYLPNIKIISANDLETLELPHHINRLLLKTDNSKLWANNESKFHKNFVGLTSDAAQWIVDRKIKLIGIDYLSIQSFHEHLVHQILLSSEVIVVEGINLAMVQTGFYELLCLPINLKGAEAAPARILLRKLSSN